MKKLTQAQVFTRRTFQGAVECSAVVAGYLVHKQYFGYTKREAIRLFAQAVNDGSIR